MPLTTTTIGAYPKPKQTPIQDWFLGTNQKKREKHQKDYYQIGHLAHMKKTLESAGADAENYFSSN